MKDIRSLHNKAMDLAEAGALANIRGEGEEATRLLRQAFELEQEAASLAAADLGLEPTRSVLHRSAASLAIDCGAFREAERLIAVALSGEPPDEIADELRDLLEQVYFQRHLALRGLSLEPGELQLAIAGKAIGFGIAPSDEYVERVQAFERLVYRTAERKLGFSYRESGSPVKDIKDNFEVFVTVPRAASMAVTMRIGRASKEQQLKMEFIKNIEANEVIDEIVYCLEVLNLGDDEALETHIKDNAYFNNFVALAKKIAPDGEDVNIVGLTVIRNGKKREVPLKKMSRIARRRPALRGVAPESQTLAGNLQSDLYEESFVEVQGKLKYADSTDARVGTIKIVADDGTEHMVIIPEGMMDDIVRPLWGRHVILVGTRTGDAIMLDHFERRARMAKNNTRKN